MPLNIERVKDYVAAMGDFEAQDVEKFDFIITASASAVENMLTDKDKINDERVLQLAAAKAYYKICCLNSAQNDLVQFSAGDVSYKEKENGTVAAAGEILQSALNDCGGLILNDGFAFLGV